MAFQMRMILICRAEPRGAEGAECVSGFFSPEGANENDSHSHLEQKSTFLRRNENDSHSHLPLERETANENDSHSHLGVWVM